MNLTEGPVAVTGGAGFLGSHLVRALYQERGIAATVYDDCSRGRLSNLNGIPFQADCGDLAERVPRLAPGSVVFHLAAKVAGIEYNRRHHYLMAQHNLAINANVFEAVRRSCPRLLVYVSTACVYAHDAPVPTPESAGEACDPEMTNRGYGVAKWVGEQTAAWLHSEYSIPVVVVRLFNAIGPGDYYDPATSHVVPALIRRVMEGDDPLYVWGSGRQTRSLVDARDIARALVLLAECNAAHDGAPVNIGHEHEVSVGELAYTVVEACGKPDLRVVFDGTKPDGHARRAPDVTRLRSLIGWVPDMPLKQTLADMVQEYREGRAHE